MDHKADIIHRLSRVEGQVQALKRSLEQESAPSCKDLLYQIKAARNALKKVGDLYITDYLDECLDKQTSPEKKKAEMEEALKALFNA